jgi:hypothetical protein
VLLTPTACRIPVHKTPSIGNEERNIRPLILANPALMVMFFGGFFSQDGLLHRAE